MTPEVKYFPNGLTVRELKALIADWPEENALGEPTEVWIETYSHSSCVVKSVYPLNMRDKGTESVSADMIFEP